MKRWAWVPIIGGLLTIMVVIPGAWINIGNLGGIAWAKDVSDQTAQIQTNIESLQKQNKSILDSMRESNKAQQKRDENLRLYLEYLLNCQKQGIEPDTNVLEHFKRSMEEPMIILPDSIR